MSDLAQRLRFNATIPLVMEAADRIEALEDAVISKFRQYEADMKTMQTSLNREIHRVLALEAALREVIDERDGCVSPGIKAKARAALAPERDK